MGPRANLLDSVIQRPRPGPLLTRALSQRLAATKPAVGLATSRSAMALCRVRHGHKLGRTGGPARQLLPSVGEQLMAPVEDKRPQSKKLIQPDFHLIKFVFI